MFGDGSMIKEDGSTYLDIMHYYQKIYGDAFIDLCERIKGGSIVGISSTGVNPYLYRPKSSYSMPGSGKCIIEYSMRIYAVTAAEMGVNVNVIVPGITKTLAWKRFAQAKGMNDKSSLIEGLIDTLVPLKKCTKPRDIGNLIKFLCSDSGNLVTGTVLPMDGGIHLK